MTQERRQQLLLLALGVLLVWFGVTRLGPLLGGPGAAGGERARLATPDAIQGGFRLASDLADLQVEELEQKPGSYTPGRDPFRFGAAPPPERPPRREPPPRREAPPEPEERQPPAGPQPPPVDVVYLGSFGSPERTIAVFADDETIYNALVGDVIKDDFRLVAIGYESADLEYVDFPDVPPARLAVGG